MKKVFNLALLFAMASSVLFVACDPKEEQTAEAKIKTIQIVNGGLSGGDIYDGVVDEATKTVTFNEVAAETNIAGIKFKTSLSLGAKLDATEYDFTNAEDPTATALTQTVTVTNGAVSQAYAVTLNLAAPSQAPILEKLVIVDDQNTEKTLTNVNIIDGILLLGCPEAAFATVKEIVLAPARSEYEFTTAQDGKILKENPGQLVVTFMGLETKYDISFGTAPKAGADFEGVKVHDFSAATDNIYPLYPGELVRGADFDGKYVLIADRATPEVHLVENLLNDNASAPIRLDLTGVEGGTHLISSGKLAHGHVYLCNLPADGVSTAIGNGPLKVYHYATPESKPEVVLAWAGTIGGDTVYTGRLGDNISVNLDESGNGYVYFGLQENADRLFRFEVKNFTEFAAEPVQLELPAIAAYYGFFNQVGANQYLYTSAYTPMLWLMDADAKVLSEVELSWTTNGARLNHGCDAHILEFNRARYLYFTIAPTNTMNWNFGPVLYLMDITDGSDVVGALTKLNEALWPEDEEAATCEPIYEYFLTPIDTFVSSLAPVAHTNAAEVDGKLVIFTSAANAGFALIEIPRAQ